MTFQSATQTTDLDRVDNITPVSATAREETRRFGTPNPVADAVRRYEPQLRAAANRARIAPQNDRQQAALTGFVAALATYDPERGTDVYTHAHPYVLAEVRTANREHSPRPAPERNQAYYWAAMDACDGDAVKARRYCELLKLCVNGLEPLAEGGDMLAREILNSRLDRYDAAVRKAESEDDVPEWDAFATKPGRGLDGPTFDAIHATVTYLDAAADLGDGEGDTAHDTTANPDAGDPFADVDDRVAFGQMVATLSERDRDIIGRYLAGETDRDAADALGISRTRVVNLRKGIIARLRKLAATDAA